VSHATRPPEVRSLRQQVTDALRQAVVSGQLQPGDRVVEEDFSQWLKISRGPVREALRQLEQEGLVQSFPYRSTVVVGVSDEEFTQVLSPIRLTLERFAFQQALAHLTEDDVATLERLIETMEEAGERDDLPQLVETDVHFHRLIVERSGQQHTIQLWHSIAPRIRAYFYRMSPLHHSMVEIAQEHRDLLAALLSRDAERVLAALDQHIVETNAWLEAAR